MRQLRREHWNAVIWTRCPKSVFVSRRTFETYIKSAVLHYNDGRHGLLEVLSKFCLSGKVTKSQKQNNLHIKTMQHKSSERCKEKQNKRIQTINKGLLDKEQYEETDSYIPGGFET